MEKTVIGVIHLRPLPGSPNYTSFEEVVDSALKDARAYEEGGVDAVVVENYGDKPFLIEVNKETVACMTAVIMEIKRETNLGIGVNVLRNDAIAALAVAKATDADFIRVNQLFFPSIMPEGYVSGDPGKIMRYRRAIDCKAMVFADIHVKHAIHSASIEDYVVEADRSLADALIVTGRTTGAEIDIEELRYVRENVKIPVLAGSGVNVRNAGRILKIADGVIVGTYFKKKGEIDVERVRRIVRIAKGER
jgi:hypothetical protein